MCDARKAMPRPMQCLCGAGKHLPRSPKRKRWQSAMVKPIKEVATTMPRWLPFGAHRNGADTQMPTSAHHVFADPDCAFRR